MSNKQRMIQQVALRAALSISAIILTPASAPAQQSAGAGICNEPNREASDRTAALHPHGEPLAGGREVEREPAGKRRGFRHDDVAREKATLNSPSAINWIKPTLLLGDQNFEGQGTNGAYKLLVSGSTATVVGTLLFEGTQQAYGFWRRAGRVVVPDYSGNIVRVYNLADGLLISTLATGISRPFGAVVSP